MQVKKININLISVIFINILIFSITNVLFDIKYEQVDDFIIYNLYSGLDGKFSIYGVYLHPVLCFIIGIFYRVIPAINWHTMFLLISQFICFTLIGYRIIEKHQNSIAIVLYTIFASIMYTAVLMLIQYTSVSGLLILTSLFLIIDETEKDHKSAKSLILIFVLYTLGIMLRMQSLLIVLPFFAMYLFINMVQYVRKKTNKEKIIKIIKYYLVCIIIAFAVYISNYIMYNTNETYKNYTEYNNIRTVLHDIAPIDYEDNKEIFDKIGWSKNDYYIFYTFGFGDENIYSKENLQSILDYKINKDGKNYFNKEFNQIIIELIEEPLTTINIMFVFFIVILIISLFNKNYTNIVICVTTIAVNALFIALERAMQRVIIPEYIMGIALMIYNLNYKKSEIPYKVINYCIVCFIIILTCKLTGNNYEYGYKYGDYKHYQDVINYTNNNKQNAYLYTVPSLQFRYLSYPVYTMPPKQAFSNLRVIGGWDMFTQNYYDFKNRYQLDGNFLDLLKDNVYLIDGDVVWSGRRYDNYKQNIALAIKEHYNIDVKYTEVEEFDNIKIYKLEESK